MADVAIHLKSLPGADVAHDVTFYEEPPYGGGREDRDTMVGVMDGAIRTGERRIRRDLMLRDVYLQRADKLALDDLAESRERVVVSPPWDGEDTLTYLPLQGTLYDQWVEDKRGQITFARKCTRFNPVTGAPVGFDEPLYTDAPFGKGINVGDVINDTHFPSFEVKSYVTVNASDSGSTTVITVKDATHFYATQLVMVSTEGVATNLYEAAKISSISGNQLTLTDTAGTAALTNTASFTRANRTYVSSNLISDGQMEDSGMGSWADTGSPSLTQKTDTMQETGSRGLYCEAGDANDGVIQTLTFQGGTDLVVFIRVRNIYVTAGGELQVRLEDQEEQYNGTAWTWLRYCYQVGGAGDQTFRLYIRQNDGNALAFVVDRVEMYENAVGNGGFEGVYVGGAGSDVAPEWAADGAGTFDESATEHSGDAAQDIDVAAAARGIVSSANVFASGAWYYVGGYFQVSSGEALISTESANEIVAELDSTVYASYAVAHALWLADATEKIKVLSDSGAADFLVDDVWAIRIPGTSSDGGPYDDAYYDLPEALSTTGFTVFGMWRPDSARDAAAIDPYMVGFSRRTYDSNDKFLVVYDESVGKLVFHMEEDGNGSVRIELADLFSAGDDVFWAYKISGAAGSQNAKAWFKVGSDATVTGTVGSGETPTGMTRMWVGRSPASYGFFARGALVCILIENSVLTDAQVEALLDLFAGTDANRLALLEEVHSVEYEIEPGSMEVIPQQLGGMYRANLTLREVSRVGEPVSVQDA